MNNVGFNGPLVRYFVPCVNSFPLAPIWMFTLVEDPFLNLSKQNDNVLLPKINVPHKHLDELSLSIGDAIAVLTD